MKKLTNSIVINGHKYDALTGDRISRLTTDGIIPAPAQKKTILQTSAPQDAAKTKSNLSTTPKPISKPGLKSVSHPTKPVVINQKQQPSKTLMRHVVHRPDISRPFKAVSTIGLSHQSTSKSAAETSHVVALKRSASSIHPLRASHASQVQKSHSITKFNSSPTLQSHKHNTVNGAQGSVSPLAPQPSAIKHNDIFQNALEQATSHQQKFHSPQKNKRQAFVSKRRFSAALTTITVLALVGLVGFANRATIGLKLAARQAGIHAELPGYQPSGFSVTKVKASPGTVAIHYASNSDNRTFALTEKLSQWDSATLRDSYVLGANRTYQTLQIGGRTVYLYGNKEASWVNGGIWYQMKTNGALSSQQISQIASSL